jgi:hypothetical protein
VQRMQVAACHVLFEGQIRHCMPHSGSDPGILALPPLENLSCRQENRRLGHSKRTSCRGRVPAR